MKSKGMTFYPWRVEILKHELVSNFQWVVTKTVTFIVYLYTRIIYPKLVFQINEVMSLSQKDPNKFWNIEHRSEEYFDCRRLSIFKSRSRFSYKGQVDENKQPHGFGSWTSEWETGEVLSGLWDHGKPIGPFKSREYRTGYSFSNVRIGYVFSSLDLPRIH